MRYRTFGRTGYDVSVVSTGTNRLGDPGVDPAQWPPIVERALELGVNIFDTSISYNQGRSEDVVGEVTSRHDIRVYLATKVGVEMMSNAFGDREFSAKTILRDIDGQLKRLRREWRGGHPTRGR